MFGWNPASGLNMHKDFPFEDGESYYLRLNNWANGNYVETVNVSLDQVTEQAAKKEAGTCWFSKPLVKQIDSKLKQAEKP